MDNFGGRLLSRRRLDGLARLPVHERDRNFVSAEKRESITTFRDRAFGNRCRFAVPVSSPDSLRQSGGVAKFVDRTDDAPGQRHSTGFICWRRDRRAAVWICRMARPHFPGARPGLFADRLGVRSRWRALSFSEPCLARLALARMGGVAN